MEPIRALPISPCTPKRVQVYPFRGIAYSTTLHEASGKGMKSRVCTERFHQAAKASIGLLSCGSQVRVLPGTPRKLPEVDLQSMRTLTSLLLLSALTTAFAASAQVIETPVATATLGQAEENQTIPLAATDGTDFFVVWQDSRGGTFGTRVTHDGRVLDPTGIQIGNAV